MEPRVRAKCRSAQNSSSEIAGNQAYSFSQAPFRLTLERGFFLAALPGAVGLVGMVEATKTLRDPDARFGC
jgi:hypothetical protein